MNNSNTINKRFRGFISVILTAALVFAMPMDLLADAPVSEVIEDTEIIEDAVADEYLESENEIPSVSGNDEDTVSVNEPDNETVIDEVPSVSEDEIPDEQESLSWNSISENKLPYGLKGMPDGYLVSSEEMEDKLALIDHGVDDSFERLKEGEDYAKQEVFFTTDDEEYARTVAEAYNGSLKWYAYGVAVISLSQDGISVEEAVNAGMDTGLNLPPVEPNYIIHTEPEEEMTYYGSLSEITDAAVSTRQSYDSVVGTYANDPFLKPTSQSYQWFHDMIKTYAAWGVTTGKASIKVAVLDSGVSDHEEFGDRLTKYTLTGIKDFKPYDDSGHGTNVAGIIAAGINNGKGGVGVAPNVSILGIPVFDENAGPGMSSFLATVVAATKYVGGTSPSSRKADIINMSLGYQYSYSVEWEKAIALARENGVTIVASAGNKAENGLQYPAAYNGVIAVAAVYPDGKRTGFSNFGSYVDIAAPGYKMWSTWNRSQSNKDAIIYTNTDGTTYKLYGSMSGTSQASPVVAGACALYMSAAGHVDPDTMEKVLRKSVQKAGSSGIGTGIIDVSKMFSVDRTPPVVTFATGSDGMVPYTGSITMKAADGITSAAGITGLGGKIVYTVNGKNPAILNGEVTRGEVYSTSIKASDILTKYNIKPGSKVTIKAAIVSGMGVLSNVKTVSFKIADQATKVTIEPVPVNGIAAGGSYRFSASVTPANASGKVTWSIVSKSETLKGTRLDAKTGQLTTKAGQTGTVTVMCTAQAGSKPTATTTLKITEALKAKKVILDKKTLSLEHSTSGSSATVKVSTVTDTAGKEINTATLKYKWTSSNPKVATVSTSTSGTVTVTATGKGKARITCKVLDGSNITAVCTVTVRQLVTSVNITGNKYAIKGKSTTYKAKATPKNANNKKLTWKLQSPVEGVTINPKTGKVTVSSGCTATGFTVVATSTDGGNASASYLVYIRSKTKSLAIAAQTSYDADVMNAKLTKSGSLKSMRMYTVDIGGKSGAENVITLRADTKTVDGSTVNNNTGMVRWSTSKASVVRITGNTEGRTVNLTALKPGTARITARSLDGSGKKSTVTIKVITPASDISVLPVNGQLFVAAGGSASNRFKLGTLHGKPSVRKVKWDYSIVAINTSTFDQETGTGATENSYVTQMAKRYKLVSVKNGKIKVSKYYPSLILAYGEYGIKAVATTTDGTGLSAASYFVVRSKQAGGMKAVFTESGRKVTGTVRVNLGEKNALSGITIIGAYDQIQTTSSNPKVISAYVDEQSNSVVALPLKTGTATVTFKANDGSGRKCKVKFKVIR